MPCEVTTKSEGLYQVEGTYDLDEQGQVSFSGEYWEDENGWQNNVSLNQTVGLEDKEIILNFCKDHLVKHLYGPQ